MVKDTLSGAAKALPAVGTSWWLWITHHDAAWWVSVGSLVYIASQLFWGWWKFWRKL